MKKTTKTEIKSLKAGEWVKMVNRDHSGLNAEKGQLMVVVEDFKNDKSSVSIFDDTGMHRLTVVFVDIEGDSQEGWVYSEDVVKVKAPQFIVAWSLTYQDPMCYFETKAEAQAFKAKLLKRRGSEKVVEVGIYTRSR